MKSFFLFSKIIIFSSIFLMSRCTGGNNGTGTGTVVEEDKPDITVPSFDKDSAYNFVAAQVAFGPRVPNTKAHDACGAWLAEKLKSFGATVTEQQFEAKAYTGVTLKGTNIIGAFNPSNPNRILLCAHWDTRHISDHDPDPAKQNLPVLGADDGASGVGILLEVARQLHLDLPEIGIDILLLDLEDHGEGGQTGDMNSWCLGSQHWSRHLHVPGYRAKFGILLDMAGASSARFTKEATSMEKAGPYLDKVWSTASSLGYGSYFVSDMTPGIIDDHYFINMLTAIPTLDIINRPAESETGFVGHWHTQNDNMNNIDRYTLRAVGQTLLTVVFYEAHGAL